MIVTIFRSRLRKEYTEEYSEVGERMESLAKEMPGHEKFYSEFKIQVLNNPRPYRYCCNIPRQ